MSFHSIAMVRTRGGSRLRPRVRFSTLEREEQAPVPAPSQTLYHLRSPRQSLRSLRDSDDTRLGWDPGPHHLCLSGDLGGPGPPSGPAHQARVSHSHPDLSSLQLHQLQRATSSPQLSPASRIRRPLFVGNPIPGNVRLHHREFHQESYYDVPALMADHRFRDSMHLIEYYSCCLS